MIHIMVRFRHKTNAMHHGRVVQCAVGTYGVPNRTTEVPKSYGHSGDVTLRQQTQQQTYLLFGKFAEPIAEQRSER